VRRVPGGENPADLDPDDAETSAWTAL